MKLVKLVFFTTALSLWAFVIILVHMVAVGGLLLAAYLTVWVMPEAFRQERAYKGPNCLPPHLNGKPHTDWKFERLGNQVTHNQTCWCGLKQPPLQLLGNQADYPRGTHDLGPKPIPPRGQWQFSVIVVNRERFKFIPIFAMTNKHGVHLGLFARWDDIDRRYVIPRIAFKIPGPYTIRGFYSATRPTM